MWMSLYLLAGLIAVCGLIATIALPMLGHSMLWGPLVLGGGLWLQYRALKRIDHAST